MQRRAAAVYFVFFLVIGAGAYSFLAVAQGPAIELDGETYSQGDSFTVDGREYTVTELGATSSDGDGHGGGGGETIAGKLNWTDETAESSTTLENGSTVTHEERDWLVAVPNESSPSTFTLHEQPNVTAILVEDPDVYDETVTIDGREHVTYRENNTNVPLSEYLPPADRKEFSEGEDFRYDTENVTATVDAVGSSGVTLVWTDPVESEIDMTEGANVTLNGRQHVVHFQNENTVQLSTQVERYHRQVDRQDYFHERQNGLWGVTILSGISAVLILGMAYMPHRE